MTDFGCFLHSGYVVWSEHVKSREGFIFIVSRTVQNLGNRLDFLLLLLLLLEWVSYKVAMVWLV